MRFSRPHGPRLDVAHSCSVLLASPRGSVDGAPQPQRIRQVDDRLVLALLAGEPEILPRGLLSAAADQTVTAGFL